MKALIVVLALTLAALGQNPASQKHVEPLSQAEIEMLAKSRAELAEAQARLADVETRIRQAHGQPKYSGVLMCSTPITRVELWGDYALVSIDPPVACTQVQ